MFSLEIILITAIAHIIDGSVYKGGKLILLAYDEGEDKYYQMENGRKIPIKKFYKYS